MLGCSSEPDASKTTAAGATSPQEAKDPATQNAWAACTKLVELAKTAGGITESHRDCSSAFSALKPKRSRPYGCALECAAATEYEKMRVCLEKCAAKVPKAMLWLRGYVGGRDIKVALSDWKRDGRKHLVTITATLRTTPDAQVWMTLYGSQKSKSAPSVKLERETKANAQGTAEVRFEGVQVATGSVSIRSKAGDEARHGSMRFVATPPALKTIPEFTVENDAGRPKTVNALDCRLKLTRAGFESLDKKIRFTNDTTYAGVTLKLSSGVAFTLDGVPYDFEGGEAKASFSMDRLATNAIVTRLKTTVPIYGSVPATLKVKDGVFQGELSCKLPAQLFDRFRTFDGKGFTFGPKDVPSGKKGAVFLRFDKLKMFVGPGKMRVRDIDYVATSTYQTKKYSDCAYRPNNGQVYTLKRSSSHENVSLFDRRTGKLLDTVLVRSPIPKCPDKVLRSTQTLAEFPSDGDVRKAIESMIAKIAPATIAP